MGASSRERRLLVKQFCARGLRLTSQRRVLLEIIDSAQERLDAASLLRLAHERNAAIDRATVYRTLDLLERLQLAGGAGPLHRDRGEYFVEAARDEDRIHLACLQCGKTEEFESLLFERLKDEIARERGFRISAVRMDTGGCCSRCIQATSGGLSASFSAIAG